MEAAPAQPETELLPETGDVAQPELATAPQPEMMDILPEEQTPEVAAVATEEPVEELAEEVVADTAADIEALMAAASGDVLSAEGSTDQDIPADSADDLLAAMSADLSGQADAGLVAEPVSDAMPAMEDELPVAETDAISAANGMLPELPESETSPAAFEAQQQDDTDPTGLESQAVLDATLAAVSAEALDAVMAQANEASSHALDAFAQAFDASNRAADAAEAVSNLAMRVEQCERALHEAGERIIALETALESQIAASQTMAAAALPRQELEGMFMEGHPLHQGLMECISKAVAEALAAAPALPPASALAAQPASADVQAMIDERLQPVIAAERSANARIDALESRLDALEPRFNDRVEKAAASAAARILREEISRLLEE